MAKKDAQALVPAQTPSRRWRNAIVEHAEVDPATLRPNDKNWRLHPRFQAEALTGALDELGWMAPICVNRTTGNMIDGHLRVELALEQGEPLVPVDYVDLTPEQEALALAVFDPLTSLAETDNEVYTALLASLETVDGTLGELLDDMRQRYTIEPPPTMDELSGQHAEPSESAFWPKIALAVPPDVYDRYVRLLHTMPGESDVTQFIALLDVVEAGEATA